MRKLKTILRMSASPLGVYEVAVRSPADEYEKADRLSAAIQPAIVIIDKAISRIYAATARSSTGETE